MTEDEQGAPSQAVHQVSGNTCASHVHTPNHDAAQDWRAQAGASEHLAHNDTEFLQGRKPGSASLSLLQDAVEVACMLRCTWYEMP